MALVMVPKTNGQRGFLKKRRSTQKNSLEVINKNNEWRTINNNCTELYTRLKKKN